MFSAFFISRTRFAMVISAIIVIAGLIAMQALPVAQFPEIVPPQVKVTASYPGANAEIVAETVAAPIEAEVNGVDDMLYMTSTSTNNGAYELDVTFAVGTDPDIAAVNVQNRVALATPKLPVEVTQQGVSVKKQSTNMLLTVNLLSPNRTFDRLFLSNYMEINLRDPLVRLAGVGDASQFGLLDYSMRIWLDPQTMTALAVSEGEIAAAIRRQNLQAAAGRIGAPPGNEGTSFTYTLQAQGRLVSTEEFENILVRTNPDGSTVRLGDVARIELGAANYDAVAYMNGASTAMLGIYLSPGANALATADQVYATLDRLAERFPDDMEYAIAYDTTDFVRASLSEVAVTLFQALALVIAVTFAFLGDWRATVIPTIAIPVSLIGTFAILLAAGMSINTISMFGLILAIGIVVDDAIVVVENTQRLIDEEKLSAPDAARKAMEEVTGPVVATTLVLLAVFVPTAFLPGITGPALSAVRRHDLDRRHPLVAGGTDAEPGDVRLAAAAVERAARPVALVLHLPRHHARRLWSGGRVARPAGLHRRPGRARRHRQHGLVVSLCPDRLHPLSRTTVISSSTSPCPTAPRWCEPRRRWRRSPTFSPPSRKSPTCCRLPASACSPALARAAACSSASSIIGTSDPIRPRVPVRSSPGFSRSFWRSAGRRRLPSRHRRSLVSAPPAASRWSCRTSGAGRRTTSPGRCRAFSSGPTSTRRIARAFTTFSAQTPQLFLNIDRQKAETLGVPINDLFTTLQANLGALYVNDFNLFGRTYSVFLQAESTFRMSPDDIRVLHVRNASGEMVPLGALLTVEPILGPESTRRFNLFRAASVNVTPVGSTGDGIAALREVEASALPDGYAIDWTGTTFQEVQAGGEAVVVLMLALLVRLSLSGRAVRELDDPDLGDPFGDDRRRRRPGAHLGGRSGQQYLHPDRPRDADRARQQERHPDRRVRQAAARAGPLDPGCRGRCRAGFAFVPS